MAAKPRVRRTTRLTRRPIKKRASRAVAETRGRPKAARATPDIVGTALAAFAHEVRTPLTGILAISNLLATPTLSLIHI